MSLEDHLFALEQSFLWTLVGCFAGVPLDVSVCIRRP